MRYKTCGTIPVATECSPVRRPPPHVSTAAKGTDGEKFRRTFQWKICPNARCGRKLGGCPMSEQSFLCPSQGRRSQQAFSCGSQLEGASMKSMQRDVHPVEVSVSTWNSDTVRNPGRRFLLVLIFGAITCFATLAKAQTGPAFSQAAIDDAMGQTMVAFGSDSSGSHGDTPAVVHSAPAVYYLSMVAHFNPNAASSSGNTGNPPPSCVTATQGGPWQNTI